MTVDPRSALPWLVGAAALVGGGLWLWWASRGFHAAWTRLMDEIKAERGGA